MYTSNIVFVLISICVTIVNASWGDTNSGQYHIQTDEGPERYFRYQTDNGQFRKERRLKDGTVIGTDAWIDAFGYLRQKDYIADSKGYRILKSKTVFVGRDRPIQEAMKVAKQSPVQGGVLAPKFQPKQAVTSVYTTTTSTTVTPLPAILLSQNVNPTSIGYDYPSPKTVYIRPHSESLDANYLPANVDRIPTTTTTGRPLYSIPGLSLEPPFADNKLSNTNIDRTPITTERPVYNIPGLNLEPPFANSPLSVTSRPEYESSTPIVSYPSSSTVSPNDYTRDYGTPIAIYPSATEQSLPDNSSPSSSFSYQTPEYHDYSTTPSSIHYNRPPAPVSVRTLPQVLSPTAIEGLNNELLPPLFETNYGKISPTLQSPEPVTYSQNYSPYISSTTVAPIERVSPINHNNIDIQPLYNRPNNPTSYQSYQPDINSQTGIAQNNNNNNNYNNNNNNNNYNQINSQSQPLYDGVSQTNNGFQYFLPRQYHEEEGSDSNKRTGSFGYIDPFGIRRVIYYKTAPGEGFVHRKNNRYVGFNATPYDPRPL